MEVLTYSDASWGGFAVQFSDKAARGCWSSADCMKSSTFREVKAIRLVLESYCEEARGKEVLHRTDNKNAELVLSVGSCNKELHQEAVAVYKLCRKLDMHLSVEWMSRDNNVEADQLAERNAKKKTCNFLSSVFQQKRSGRTKIPKQNCPKTTKILTLYGAGDEKTS